MKKLLIFALLSTMAMETVCAQGFSKAPVENRHNVGVAIGSFIGRPRLKYEYLWNEKISVGTMLSVYTGSPRGSEGDYFVGAMLSPIARYYFGSKAAGNGLYVQGKLNFGQFQEKLSTETDGFINGNSFFSAGAGANLGYQMRISKTRWGIDINVGLKFCSSNPTIKGDSGSWGNLTEAGSLLDTNLSICYRF